MALTTAHKKLKCMATISNQKCTLVITILECTLAVKCIVAIMFSCGKVHIV